MAFKIGISLDDDNGREAVLECFNVVKATEDIPPAERAVLDLEMRCWI